MPSRFKTAFQTEGKGASAPFSFYATSCLRRNFPPSRFFKKPVILPETKKMTHAYSIDASSSDDTDWILLDFDEPAPKSGKVRDTNVREKKTAPLSRKPAKKARVKKPQVETGSTSRNTAEKARKLKAAPSIPAQATTTQSTAADLKTASGKKRRRTPNLNSKQNRKTKV